MNRDDIIRMAREANVWIVGRDPYPAQLERFAKAIEQHLSYDSIHTCHDKCQRPACVAVREAVRAEREACAKVCDDWPNGRDDVYSIGEAIRARGEK
jgi:hypothetical protein